MGENSSDFPKAQKEILSKKKKKKKLKLSKGQSLIHTYQAILKLFNSP